MELTITNKVSSAILSKKWTVKFNKFASLNCAHIIF